MSLQEMIQILPPDLQKQVREFIERLIDEHAMRHHQAPRLEWAGALEDLRGQYSSVELQHEISTWRRGAGRGFLATVSNT
jgi:hypothetical protein